MTFSGQAKLVKTDFSLTVMMLNELRQQTENKTEKSPVRRKTEIAILRYTLIQESSEP